MGQAQPSLRARALVPMLLALLPRRADTAAVSLTIDGRPAAPGNYTKAPTSTFVFDNGLATVTFVAQGGGVNMASWTVAGVAGLNLASTTEASWYEDWSGGKNGDVAGVDTYRVTRVSAELVELVLADTKHPQRRLEQHIVMTSATRGLYTYTAMTVVAAGEALNEIRHNTRWNRCVLNYALNHERPSSQQPTYPYLYTQVKIQDETWQVDARNNATLPCPADNAGNADGKLPAGSIYTKYDWSLYHHENPYFGHWGQSGAQLVGLWLTPLGGVTNATSAATYGVGPDHQDLAIHQDDLILNYMGANHYGTPAEPVPKGYTRFFGPYLHHASVGAASDPAAFFADALAVAQANIAASLTYLPVVQHPWYPAWRSNVTGSVTVSDGRPGAGLWVVLSTAKASELFTIHEPTRFVLTTGADGRFVVPGVPPGSYTLYLSAASGSVTDQFVSPTPVVVTAGVPVIDLGAIVWTPSDAGRTLLWQIGAADRTGGEFALAREPRDWFLPGRVPGDLTFTIGTSYEPTDWFYAQTQGGTWTVRFSLPSAPAPADTAFLTVAASMTDGDSPTVAVNGDASGISGAVPSGGDSTLSRQAVRSGFPRVGVLTFSAARLKQGDNTITFTRSAARANNNTGMGYDTVKLQVAGAAAKAGVAPALRIANASLVAGVAGAATRTVRIAVANAGGEHALCARLDAFAPAHGSRFVFVDGHDPAIFPLPLGNVLGGGGGAHIDVLLRAEDAIEGTSVLVRVSADGGRTSAEATIPIRM